MFYLVTFVAENVVKSPKSFRRTVTIALESPRDQIEQISRSYWDSVISKIRCNSRDYARYELVEEPVITEVTDKVVVAQDSMWPIAGRHDMSFYHGPRRFGQ